MAFVRCCGGAKRPKTPFELITNGVFQNGCTGTNFVSGSGYLTVPWSTQCVLTIPEYVSGYTQLQIECETTNATGTDVLRATCAGNSNKASQGSGHKTFIVPLNVTDTFNRVEFDVVDRNGNINQRLFNAVLLP